MSKAAENRFFGSIYFDYNSRPDGWDRLRQFFDPTTGVALLHRPLLGVRLRFHQRLHRPETRHLDAVDPTMKRLVLLCLLLISATAFAHVGNKDVFETVNAGPYKLFVTIRPPVVIPGVAAVEIRTGRWPSLEPDQHRSAAAYG